MKKVLLVVLGIVLAYGVNAQLRFGVKAAGTLSQIIGVREDITVSDPKFGFEIGGLLEYSFSESLSLQPGLLFVNSGGANFELEYTISLNQVQLPVYLKYKVGGESVKFYGSAGPYLGYIFSAKEKDYDGESYNLFDEDDVEYPMKHFDFGVGLDLGLEFANRFTVGAGYKFGIANLASGDGTASVTTLNMSVGFLF
jgi:hypothetical protein